MNQSHKMLEASEMFLNILKDEEIVVLILNAEGRYICISNKASHLHYRPAKELMGKTVYEIFPKHLADLAISTIGKALAEKKCISTEYELEIGSEKLWFEGIAIPFVKDSVIWLAKNITDSKLSEQIVLEAVSVIDRIDN